MHQIQYSGGATPYVDFTGELIPLSHISKLKFMGSIFKEKEKKTEKARKLRRKGVRKKGKNEKARKRRIGKERQRERKKKTLWICFFKKKILSTPLEKKSCFYTQKTSSASSR